MMVVVLKRTLETWNPSLNLPSTTITSILPKVYLLPILNQHLLHTSHMQIILLALGPVAPAPPLPPTLVARGGHLPVEEELHVTIVEHPWEVGAARVQVEPARPAVVDESADVLLAGVAEAGDVAGGPVEELEGALGVEGVGDGGGGEGTVLVQVKVTQVTLVSGPYANLPAPITLEGHLNVLKFEFVLGVAEVGDLTILHYLVLALTN